MNKTLAILLLLCLPFVNNAAPNKKIELNKQGKISYEWDNKTQDVGSIPQNSPKTVEFKLKNTGELPVAIVKAEGSCGCTQITYPEEPIKPGQSGIVKTTYNAASKGAFNKSIKVSLSNNESESLTVKGVVE